MKGVENGGLVRSVTGVVAFVLVLVGACGDAPLQSVGEKSSEWINEPTVPTTAAVVTTAPVVVTSEILKWFNDSIVSESMDDPGALLQEIFRRRGGDLIIQSSRAEMMVLLPELKFPSVVPYLAEYVTSQIVFSGSGQLADDPVVGFGLWSSEPYTRSRSVAQMVVLWVSFDEDAAAELAEPGADTSCARFSGSSTQSCEIRQIGDTTVWSLRADNGNTMVWLDGSFRYELFGRTSVPVAILERMIPSFAPIGELATSPG